MKRYTIVDSTSPFLRGYTICTSTLIGALTLTKKQDIKKFNSEKVINRSDYIEIRNSNYKLILKEI